LSSKAYKFANINCQV